MELLNPPKLLLKLKRVKVIQEIFIYYCNYESEAEPQNNKDFTN